MREGTVTASAGGGVRPSPTARPMVAANSRASIPPKRISAEREVGSAASAGSALRRCARPTHPIATSATAFATTRRPYVVVKTSDSGIRTNALINPDSAITISATVATWENRRTATSVCAPPRRACTSTANSPPAHSDAPTRCQIKLLVATSCAPPAEECPVSASGMSESRPNPSRIGIHPHRRAVRHPMTSSNASRAVHNHTLAAST